MIQVYASTTHTKIDYRNCGDNVIVASETILKEKFQARDDSLMRNPMVRRGLMSPVQSFYNEDLNLLPTGLLPYLKIYYKTNNIPFEFFDLRRFPAHDKDYLNQEVIKLGNSTLRGYQLEVLRILASTRGGIVQAPTGVGKGTMFASLLRLYPYCPILCLFNRIELVNQTRNELINDLGFSPKEIGIVQGNNFDDQKRITILSVASYEKAQHIFPRVGVIICDEVHETGRNPTSEKIIYSCQNAPIHIGLTATTEIDNPYERMKMFSIIGPIVYKSTIKEKIEENFLAKINITMYEIGKDVHVPICGSYADIYDKRRIGKANTEKTITEEYALANGYTILGSGNKKIARKFLDYGDESNLYLINDERNELIASIARKKKRCLILFDKHKQGQELARLLPEAFLVHGKSELRDRQKAKDLLKQNENQIVIASSIFATGVNIPSIRAYINAGAGKGNCKTIQKLGRTTRLDKSTDKTEAEVIDFYDHYNAISIKQSNKRLKIYTELLEFDIKVVTI